jgi:hypothetical protein
MSDMLQLVVSCGGFSTTGMGQRMSDMLQLVVSCGGFSTTGMLIPVMLSPAASHDKLKHIGHSLSHSLQVEW